MVERSNYVCFCFFFKYSIQLYSQSLRVELKFHVILYKNLVSVYVSLSHFFLYKRMVCISHLKAEVFITGFGSKSGAIIYTRFILIHQNRKKTNINTVYVFVKKNVLRAYVFFMEIHWVVCATENRGAVEMGLRYLTIIAQEETSTSCEWVSERVSEWIFFVDNILLLMKSMQVHCIHIWVLYLSIDFGLFTVFSFTRYCFTLSMNKTKKIKQIKSRRWNTMHCLYNVLCMWASLYLCLQTYSMFNVILELYK